MMQNQKTLTTANGNSVYGGPVSGSTGCTLVQDGPPIEKSARFDRERIPERAVRAGGAGAFGYFKVTNDLSKYTRARLFGKAGGKTELFARFSTDGGERSPADPVRDPRGFAVKFYTEEGNYDLVGSNMPVFFIRDAIKFPDFIRTRQRNSGSNLKDATMFWDFLSLAPESLHQVTILFSDRGTPASYQEMDGYSSHAFMWYNDRNEYVWVKYHFKAAAGFRAPDAGLAEEPAKAGPGLAARKLYEAIERGDFPKWKLYVQIMTPEQAKASRFDPFDVTKVWYHADFPLIELGEMVLDRNPDHYFQNVGLAAFNPANFVPGIGPSPDKLLLGRLFAGGDMQDGPEPGQAFTPPAIDISGSIARHDIDPEDIDFEQPGELYRRVLGDKDKTHLVANIAGHLCYAKKNIQLRQCALFYKADREYGTRVANALRLELDTVRHLSMMSQDQRVKLTL